jgi:hypothetical protein
VILRAGKRLMGAVGPEQRFVNAARIASVSPRNSNYDG